MTSARSGEISGTSGHRREGEKRQDERADEQGEHYEPVGGFDRHSAVRSGRAPKTDSPRN